MKKVILTMVVAGAVAADCSYGQGIFTFSAGGGKVKYTTDGSTLTSAPVGTPSTIPGFGTLNVGFFSAPNGTVLSLSGGVPNFSGWSFQSSTSTANVGPIAGAIGGTGITLNAATGAAGATEEVEVVGWTGPAASWAAAVGGSGLIGWGGSTLSTGALGWPQPTGTSQSPAVQVTGPGGFNGLVLQPQVPEPTSIALGGLGAAALLLFRRRK